MHAISPPVQQIARGAWNLFVVSLMRLIRSRQSWICLLLLAFATLAVIAWGRGGDRPELDFVEQIVMGVFLSFLLPIYCLCYGAAGIAADREEETLVYVLVSPLPRAVIYLAKLLAALSVVLVWTLGSLALLCLLAGPPGRAVWWQSNLPVLLGALAYTSLFHLFGVIWRRAALVGLAYTFFFEVLMSNIPGIAQRFAVAFYLRHLLRFATDPDSTATTAALQTLSPETSRWILGLLIVTLVALGTAWFDRREY
jgi:ABC-2 type transport system permease protein